MDILALDLASSLGWALKDGDRKIKYGTEKLQNDTWDGAGFRFVRFHRFLEQHKDVDLIVYEAVEFSTTTRATQMWGAWVGILQMFCESNNIPYTAYGVSKIKKFATGKGTAKKKDMVEACREWGYNPRTDDEADAICILKLALSEVTTGEDQILRRVRKED